MDALPRTAREALEAMGGADVLIGIPSFHNAQTIGHVVETAGRGAFEAFPDLRTVILNADGGSTDGTREAATSARLPEGITVVSTTYGGIPGKGSAVRAVFEAAQVLGARGCATLDADLRSIEPWWIERLVGPILRGEADYVAPYYRRHPYDGTITNHIAYPMTRALYGLRVRQPIGGDFGFSGAFAGRALRAPVWESDVARFGIDIWMTTTAICEGGRVVQAHLGRKVHNRRDPAGLGPMFRQVVGTLFSLMGRYADRWRAVQTTHPTPMVGEPVAQDPEPVPVSVPTLLDRFREGLVRYGPLWERVTGQDVYPALAQAFDRGRIRLPEAVWAKICYDFAVAFHRPDLEGAQVLEALVPLYFGRVAAFVQETDQMTPQEAEAVIERQAEVFEALKVRLVAAWKRRWACGGTTGG
jgi:hypothetical protein